MGVQVNLAGGHTGKIAAEIPSTHHNFHALEFNSPFNIFNKFKISFYVSHKTGTSQKTPGLRKVVK